MTHTKTNYIDPQTDVGEPDGSDDWDDWGEDEDDDWDEDERYGCTYP